MKKKKKNGKAVSLLLLLLAVVGLFAVYRILSAQTAQPSDETGDTASDVIMLIQRTPAEVAQIAYTADGVTYGFVCDPAAGTWTYKEDPRFPLNQTTAANMAAAICQIGVFRELEEGDQGEYGFDVPALTVSVKYTDGLTCEYAVGDLNKITGNRYFKDLSTDKVYVISAALMQYFDYTLPDLFTYDTLPTDMEPSYITSVVLHTADSEKTFAENEDCTALYGLFTALVPTQYADWYADEAEKAAYGIGSLTMTVSYKRAVTISDESGNTNTTRIPAEYTVTFGNTVGDSVYYMLSGSDVVYTVSSDKVDAILQYGTAVNE